MTNRSLLVMHNIRSSAKHAPRRIIFADGESDRVLEACRVVVAEGLAKPTLLGRPEFIRQRAEALNIDLNGVPVVDSSGGERHEELAQMLFAAKARRGYDIARARRMVQLPIHQGCMLLRAGEADGMVCGAQRSYVETLKIVLSLAEMKEGVSRVVGMHVLLIEGRAYVFADTTVNFKPDAKQLADIAVQACRVARQFAIDPNVAMLSFSTFGDNEREEARAAREAVAILHREHPDVRVEGEMRADAAVLPGQLAKLLPDSRLSAAPNVFVFPDLQSANIAYKLVGHMGNREIIGPLLVGLKQPIHMVSLESTVDEIVNMAALASYEAGR
jgi:malate dehydrogenase (oxaloacetate-decarboxylating)(NADP+)